MKISSLRFYRGANIYAARSVLAMVIQDIKASNFDGEALRQTLLAAPFHMSIQGDDEKWPRGHDSEPVGAIDWIARTAILLQVQTGAMVDFCTAVETREGEATAVFGYEHEVVAREAGRLATMIVAWFTKSPRPDARRIGRHFAAYKKRALSQAVNFYTLPMIEAARDRGIPWGRIQGTNYYRLGTGARQQMVLESGAQTNNWIARNFTQSKVLTHHLLRAQGLPVAQQITTRSAEESVRAAKNIGYPVVVKPPNMKQGIGVHLNLNDANAVRAATIAAQRYSRVVLVENYFVGKDHRMLVIGDELVAVAWRRPAQVSGDGVRVIEDLISELNRDPRRADHNQAPLKKIIIDDEVTHTLAEQNLKVTDVLASGRTIPLRRIPNMATGGEPVNLLDQVHPENRQIALDAARTLGLSIAGIDFLCPDISRPFSDVGGIICEINSIPGLDPHYDTPGGMKAVAGKIVDLMFAEPNQACIPVVIAPGQGEWTKQLSELLGVRGHRAGTWIDGHTTISQSANNETLSNGLSNLLQSPLIDVACLAPGANEVLHNGMGCENATWAVLPNSGIDRRTIALLGNYCQYLVLKEDQALPSGLTADQKKKVIRLPHNIDLAIWMADLIEFAIRK